MNAITSAISSSISKVSFHYFVKWDGPNISEYEPVSYSWGFWHLLKTETKTNINHKNTRRGKTRTGKRKEQYRNTYLKHLVIFWHFIVNIWKIYGQKLSRIIMLQFQLSIFRSAYGRTRKSSFSWFLFFGTCPWLPKPLIFYPKINYLLS